MRVNGQPEVVEVVADWEGLDGPRVVGDVRVARARGKDVFSFEYASTWLADKRLPPIDPELPLVRGPQFAAAGRASFGVLLDSAPDRWGRVLMQRREALDDEVVAAVGHWRQEARRARIGKAEQDRMANAFRIAR